MPLSVREGPVLSAAFHSKPRNWFRDMNIINTTLWSDSSAAAKPRASVLLCSWYCGHIQNEEVAYANYWLEFSQRKLIGQFKTHYANSARPSLAF